MQFQENGIFVNLELSDSAPDSISSINKDGHKFVLLWNYEKTRACIMVTNEIEIEIYGYIKFLVDRIHEHNIGVQAYFHIGRCYTIVRSPYIYRFILVETEKDDPRPIILRESEEQLKNTIVVEKTLSVKKGNDTPDYVNQAADALYYKPHIEIIKKYLNRDVAGVIHNFLSPVRI